MNNRSYGHNPPPKGKKPPPPPTPPTKKYPNKSININIKIKSEE